MQQIFSIYNIDTLTCFVTTTTVQKQTTSLIVLLGGVASYLGMRLYTLFSPLYNMRMRSEVLR